MFLKKDDTNQAKSNSKKVDFRTALKLKQAAIIEHANLLDAAHAKEVITEANVQSNSDNYDNQSELECNNVTHLVYNNDQLDSSESYFEVHKLTYKVDNAIDNVVKQNLLISEALDNLIAGVNSDNANLESLKLLIDLTKKSARRANILSLNAFIEIAGIEGLRDSNLDKTLENLRKSLQFISDYLCQISDITTGVTNSLDKRIDDLQNTTAQIVPVYIEAKSDILEVVEELLARNEKLQDKVEVY